MIRNFSHFFGTWIFITLITKAHEWNTVSSGSVSLRSAGILILYSSLFLMVYSIVNFRRVRKITERDYLVFHVSPSVRMEQHGSQWTDFRIVKYVSIFLKICRENSSFIKTGQEQKLLYVKTITHFWFYLAQLFLEWKIFQTKLLRKWRHTFTSSNVSLKIVPFMR